VDKPDLIDELNELARELFHEGLTNAALKALAIKEVYSQEKCGTVAPLTPPPKSYDFGYCDCSTCLYSDHPCSFDCLSSDPCEGCAETAQIQAEWRKEIKQ
jgi:hypothetical protein